MITYLSSSRMYLGYLTLTLVNVVVDAAGCEQFHSITSIIKYLISANTQTGPQHGDVRHFRCHMCHILGRKSRSSPSMFTPVG